MVVPPKSSISMIFSMFFPRNKPSIHWDKPMTFKCHSSKLWNMSHRWCFAAHLHSTDFHIHFHTCSIYAIDFPIRFQHFPQHVPFFGGFPTSLDNSHSSHSLRSEARQGQGVLLRFGSHHLHGRLGEVNMCSSGDPKPLGKSHRSSKLVGIFRIWNWISSNIFRTNQGPEFQC